jgi:hypothetical protein
LGHLLFSFIGSLLESFYKLLRRRIRQAQLSRYAKSHDYAFSAKNCAESITFSADVFSRSPSKEYKVGRAANIIQGSMNGLRFIYFEKTLIEVGEDGAEEPVATCSVVSIARSSGQNFESRLAIDKDLPFYRENDGTCFWWNDAGPESKAIPVRKLDHWLTDIASTFKTETSRPTLAHERA